MTVSQSVVEFGREHGLETLSAPSIHCLMKGDYDLPRAKQFVIFQQRINREMLTHSVITRNDYCRWFAKGVMADEQVKAFIVQFSVFSNQFLVAQLLKMLAANSIEEMHASKEILVNELGVVFVDGSHDSRAVTLENDEQEFGEISGSIEGGRFGFGAAHFELLLKTAKSLNLGFSDLGKRPFGSAETLHFCDELKRLYGSDDYMTSAAASYAVENWAAAGFWEDLVAGLKCFRETSGRKNMPITFFTWHSKLEANHARHTQEELEELFFTHDFDWDRFITVGNEMLDGVNVFWQGLDQQRQLLH